VETLGFMIEYVVSAPHGYFSDDVLKNLMVFGIKLMFHAKSTVNILL
jgi:hypothetical protein